jgi:hypothetical protein
VGHESGFCTLTISAWDLATARAAHPELEDSPLAVLSGGRVLEASPAATKMGVSSGMTPREAHSCLPSVALVELDDDLSERAFAPIVQAIFEVTPFVQIERPGYLHFPLEGVMRFYKSPEALAERILASLPSSAVLRVQGDTTPALGVGIAPSRFASLLAAMRASELAAPLPFSAAAGGELESGGEYLSLPAGWISLDLEASPAAFVGEFPIEVLSYVMHPGDPHDIDVWHLLGIHTLADIASLDPSSLVDRFGEWAGTAWTLANGRDPDVLLPVTPPRDLDVSYEFDPPASTLDRLMFACGEVGTRLEQKLSAEALGCRYLRLEVLEQSGRTLSVSWRVEGSVMLSAQRCRWHLESMAVSSPVTCLRLIPQEIVPLRGIQLAIEGIAPGASYGGREWESAKRALARAESIFGEEAAYFVETGISGSYRGHLPHEDAGLIASSLIQDYPHDSRRTPMSPRTDNIQDAAAPLPGALPLPYPASVLQVEITSDSCRPQISANDCRTDESPSRPFLKEPARVTTIQCSRQPVVVRRGPRITDPPESVDGLPVLSAAGPWSYLLRWWDEQRSFVGEMWQVVLDDSQQQSARLIFRSQDGLWYLYAIYD